MQLKLTRKRVWKFLSANVTIGQKLTARGERLYQMFLRRNQKYGYPREHVDG